MQAQIRGAHCNGSLVSDKASDHVPGDILQLCKLEIVWCQG